MKFHQFGAYRLLAPNRATAHTIIGKQQSKQFRSGPLYVICTNPRSGSWLLSEGLSRTSVAGNPREWFNPLEQQKWNALWRLEYENNLTAEAYVRLASLKSRTANGVSGVKLHYFQLDALHKITEQIPSFAGLSPIAAMEKLLPNARYIWLQRRDKTRQAISLQLALGTNQWWSIADVKHVPDSQNTSAPSFDPEAITGWRTILQEHDRKWLSFFRSIAARPLIIQYEDLAADYASTIRKVVEWLEVPAAKKLAIPPPRLQQQSSPLTESWLRQYRIFIRNRGANEHLPTLNESENPLTLSTRGPPRQISDLWKRWIAQSRLTGVSDQEIAMVLIENGHDRDSALKEVNRSASDPYLAIAQQLNRRLIETQSLATARTRMAQLSPQTAAIQRCSKLTREEFRDRFYAANQPVVLQGLMENGWKAMTAWTPSYLKAAVGDVEAEVMTHGSNVRNATAPNQLLRMPFARFIDSILAGPPADQILIARNKFLQLPAARSLFADFSTFPDYLCPRKGDSQTHLWISRQGRVAEFYRTPCNMFFAQVAGRQLHRLILATPRPSIDNPVHFSESVAGLGQRNQQPNMRDKLRPLEFILEPGEVLFAPVAWQHEITALETNITISFTNFVFPNSFNWDTPNADLSFN